MKNIVCRILFLQLALSSVAFTQDDVVMKAMRDELSRSMTQLHLADLDKPYFIAYRVTDNSTTKVSATLGQLTDKTVYRGRRLAVEVRVGDYKLDNTNFVGVHAGGNGSCGCHSTLPIDDDYGQIRREIWLATDGEYKAAAGQLSAKRSVLEHRQRGQQLADFTAQQPITLAAKPADLKLDTSGLEDLARELSSVFRGSPEILSSGLDLYLMNTYVRFIDSEGTSFTRSVPIVTLDVRASTQAADGQPLSDAFRIYGVSADALRRDELLGRTRELLARIKALRTAPVLDAYNGPVLFEQDASAQVVSQVLAPALIASRIPISDEPRFEAQFQQFLSQFGGTLADKVGGRILPEGFNLIDNPRATQPGDGKLLASYDVDDEGTPSHEVKLVDNGILKSLLAGRTPTPQTKTSTGSVRGLSAAPSNVFLTASKASSESDLRKQLVQAAQQRGYDFGIVVRDVMGANVSPLMRMSYGAAGSGGAAVYKVYADGHEELVRADIATIALNDFKDILAAGDKASVHDTVFIPFSALMLARASGMEMENNFVVSSYSVPSLLFEELSLKSPTGTTPKPPVLASPMASLRSR
jgi:predicted Zn-dependent protease